ncbi:MAG: basic amino acid ABC transporter substrate-binding protein [Oscillospiraceae bacterium]|jgi:ABC-type amino acid transport substrate-binding protein
MKKFTVVLSLMLVALLVLAGCGAKEAPSQAAPSQDATAQPTSKVESSEQEAPSQAEGTGLDGKTKLIMGTEAGFAPYEYYDEAGNVVGVDPDVAQAIADALNMELEIQEMDFDAIIPEVQSGRIDFGAAGMTVTEERSKQVDFSIPYATSKQIIVVRVDNTEITGPDVEILAGKKVGVQLGTVADYELSDNYPDTTVERYKKYFEAVSDLLNGRIDAIAMDVLPAQEFIAQNSDLKILEQELMIDEYAIAVQKGNTELLNAINEVLQDLIDSGKIDEFTVNHTVTNN